MILDLTDTNASKIDAALTRARRSGGGPALGMVLTLVAITDERTHYDAIRAAADSAREHPSRIIAVINRGGRGKGRLDAEVRVGGEAGPGETILLRLYGELSHHADSVVLPLLLPDAPVVVWWPNHAPDVPGDDPLGALAQRRVTDAAAETKPLSALRQRADGYRPGDTDLAWTRLTPWRAVLAAALDQPFDPVRSAVVAAQRSNPSAELLAAWLGLRLNVPVERKASRGPGITAVRLETERGDIALTRPDGRLARLARPGDPDRTVALARRDIPEILAEELRRLDPDEVYEYCVRAVADEDDANATANSTANATANASPPPDPSAT
jgi:glucose-6-phosphate dehydrogenase assembly protein OpcA